MIGWSKGIGSWAEMVGSLFTILAMLTTYWSISLALADIVEEQLKLSRRLCWVIATLPFGYVDGPPRDLSYGVGYVTIHGRLHGIHATGRRAYRYPHRPPGGACIPEGIPGTGGFAAWKMERRMDADSDYNRLCSDGGWKCGEDIK